MSIPYIYFFCSGTWFSKPFPLKAEIKLSKTSSSIYAESAFNREYDW